VTGGKPADFNAIPMGRANATPLINPQSGLAFDLEGTDSHQLVEPPSPALASAWRAGEAVEDYWMALLRDVPFSAYGTDPIAQAAIADLNQLSDFRGPKVNGLVTAGTLFRGFTAADVIGPYISQFFYPTLAFGAGQIIQQYQTYTPGSDLLTDFASYLACQNGAPSGSNPVDPTRRYLRNGRDIGAWVHIDVLYQAYFQACLYLIGIGAQLNPGNPYAPGNPAAINQTGFGTFGVPYLKAILAAVSSRALKAQWFQKWYVHRTLRPEAYGGLVHLAKVGTKSYPLHSEVLNSNAVAQTFSHNGTYLLPMEFPEGCPQHPSYGSGHATVGGACVTILKAFFDETQVIQNPVAPSDDGLSLAPYTGADAGLLTVGGELNKIASNVAFGRNIAGVHWRTDAEESMRLGEAVAISVLRDEKACYNEDFHGFTFTKFDGTRITV
jgi:membrane-associated phospholipid phosphatase